MDHNEQSGEIWKNYNDLYQVSNFGNVRSLLSGKNLKLVNSEYLQVSLTRKIPAIKVHRLVAELFLPNMEGKKTVNHKDGNKHNNHIENLEWATYKENNRHAIATGLNSPRGADNPPKGSDHWNSILDETQIKTIRRCSKDGISNGKLGRYFGVTPSLISGIRNGKRWAHVL